MRGRAILQEDVTDLTFEWHSRKARANLEKHGIAFSEAVSVFGDPLARIFADEAHSADEHREIIVGHSQEKRASPVFFYAAGGRPSQDHQRPPRNQVRTARL